MNAIPLNVRYELAASWYCLGTSWADLKIRYKISGKRIESEKAVSAIISALQVLSRNSFPSHYFPPFNFWLPIICLGKETRMDNQFWDEASRTDSTVRFGSARNRFIDLVAECVPAPAASRFRSMSPS